jgi:uncharacterized protein (TIGR02145 family)
MSLAQRDAIANPAEGLMIFNTTTNCPNYFSAGVWYNWCGTLPAAVIGGLNCAGAIHQGALFSGEVADGVVTALLYSGGNGGTYGGQSVNSAGVTGLVATLEGGTLSVGNGSLSFAIAGTPEGVGTAHFNVVIGGQSCAFSREVAVPPFTCGVSQVEDADNHLYNTVEIAGMCWMRENLQVTKTPSGNAITSYCYNNNPAFCSEGRLYQWGIMMNGSASSNASPSGVQGICPDGWHVPSQAEYGAMTALYGVGSGTAVHYRSPSWGGAPNTSGFSALPTGIRFNNGTFDYRGFYTVNWTSTETNGTAATRFDINSNNGMTQLNEEAKEFWFALRCIRNY